MTIDAPKPGPTAPIHLVRGAGVNRDDVEARSRIIAMLLPHSRDAITTVEDLLTVADYIEHGDDEEDAT